jgi:hypothetical protein
LRLSRRCSRFNFFLNSLWILFCRTFSFQRILPCVSLDLNFFKVIISPENKRTIKNLIQRIALGLAFKYFP